MPGNYTPNQAGFRALALGPEIRAALQAIGEEAKTIAVGLSQDFRVTGEYVDSFEVQQTTINWEGPSAGPRAAVRLMNTAPYAAAVEWGNAHTPHPHRVLGKTLDALGGR